MGCLLNQESHLSIGFQYEYVAFLVDSSRSVEIRPGERARPRVQLSSTVILLSRFILAVLLFF